MTNLLHEKIIVIDGLIISKFDRSIFEAMHAGGITAANCTCSIWENFYDSMKNIAEFKKHFDQNSDLIIQVFTTADIARAKREGKTGIILGWQNLSGIEDQISFLKLFKDLGDQYIFEQSLRPFNSTSSTTIPNDQGAFADFCYGSMVSCKEGNMFACARNLARHTN